MTKEQPNDPVSQMRLGEAYEKQGASDKAAAAFEQAVKLNPKLASGVTSLARLYAGPLQNKEKALAYAKKARELAPGKTPRSPPSWGKSPTTVAISSGHTTFSKKPPAYAKTIRAHPCPIWLGQHTVLVD